MTSHRTYTEEGCDHNHKLMDVVSEGTHGPKVEQTVQYIASIRIHTKSTRQHTYIPDVPDIPDIPDVAADYRLQTPDYCTVLELYLRYHRTPHL